MARSTLAWMRGIGPGTGRLAALIALTAALGAGAPAASAAAPANDDFADATTVTSLPARFEGSTEEATFEPGEPGHGAPEGVRSVWFKWTAPADGRVAVETCEGQIVYP